MEKIIKGCKVNYKESGNGEKTIVILQGWGTNMEVYNSMASVLMLKYKVVQFDFPGFGSSQEPPEPWTVDDFADFFVEFLDEIGVQNATLIGHSYGGRVIIKLAAREEFSPRIEKIVLVDSAGVLPQRSMKQKARIALFKIVKKVANMKIVYKMCQELIDDWKSKQGSEDYRKASPIMRACLVKAVNEDLTRLLKEIKQETLLIWGENDTATPMRDAKIMEEQIPNAGLAVINGAGHFCFLEKPVIFEKILKSYFRIEG